MQEKKDSELTKVLKNLNTISNQVAAHQAKEATQNLVKQAVANGQANQSVENSDFNFADEVNKVAKNHKDIEKKALKLEKSIIEARKKIDRQILGLETTSYGRTSAPFERSSPRIATIKSSKQTIIKNYGAVRLQKYIKRLAKVPESSKTDRAKKNVLLNNVYKNDLEYLAKLTNSTLMRTNSSKKYNAYKHILATFKSSQTLLINRAKTETLDISDIDHLNHHYIKDLRKVAKIHHNNSSFFKWIRWAGINKKTSGLQNLEKYTYKNKNNKWAFKF